MKATFTSIHALQAECDIKRSLFVCTQSYFNPRTPSGVRHCFGLPIIATLHYFNPRTPSGVRPASYALSNLPYSTSIHALQAECDCRRFNRLIKIHILQSTHSKRSATCFGLPIIATLHYFNPRTPSGVRRVWTDPTVTLYHTSIHALQAECDNRGIKWLLT